MSTLAVALRSSAMLVALAAATSHAASPPAKPDSFFPSGAALPSPGEAVKFRGCVRRMRSDGCLIVVHEGLAFSLGGKDRFVPGSLVEVSGRVVSRPTRCVGQTLEEMKVAVLAATCPDGNPEVPRPPLKP